MGSLQGIEIGPSCYAPLKQAQPLQTVQAPRGGQIVDASKLLDLPARYGDGGFPQGAENGDLPWGRKQSLQVYA
jgi:hypothetical protein